MVAISFDVVEHWEKRDRRALPFLNFMRITLEEQIENGWTANAMAEHLGLDHKTFTKWVNSIESESVLSELIAFARLRYKNLSVPKGVSRLESTLTDRVDAIDRSKKSTMPDRGNLPETEKFCDAIDFSYRMVFKRYARKIKDQKGLNESVDDISREIGNGLKWAYTYKPTRELDRACSFMVGGFKDLANAVIQIRLLQVMSFFPADFGVDLENQDRLIILREDVEKLRARTTNFIDSYMKSIQEVAMGDHFWSERASAQYPVSSLETSSLLEQKRIQMENLMFQLLKISDL